MKSQFNILKKTLFVIALAIFSSSALHAEDLRKIVSLSGYWKFSIGDRAEWSEVDYDDSNWDKIHVPDDWENEGYHDYNGYAWYRKSFTITRLTTDEPIYFVAGRIDDCDEVYLNGKLIGKMGAFPPRYESAWGYERKYVLPRNYLNVNGPNIIAVRVYDAQGSGGLTAGGVGLFIDEDFSFIDYNLAGKWKFKTGDSKYYRTAEYDDSKWKYIEVPSAWENKGYENYDGYAWYRKKFTLPNKLKDKELYVNLGRIDDYDQVYLNGELIGNVFDLKKDSDYRARGWEYNARRVYKIPSEHLKQNGENTLAIRVYDKHRQGGIWQGPIGLMTKSSEARFTRKHYDSRSFWDYFLDEFDLDYD